jgi:hypothetical protein
MPGTTEGAGGTATATGGAKGSGAGGTAGVVSAGGGRAGGGVNGAGGSAGGGAIGTGGSGAMGGIAGGAGGAAGTIGTGGTGPAGSGGATGGRGGATATGGRGGGTMATGGGTGAHACPSGGVLDCSSGGALALTPDGQVTSFSPADWNNTSGVWCDADGLEGSIFAYTGGAVTDGGPAATATAGVDTTAQNLRFDLHAAQGSAAGGGLLFDSCVDASAFNALQFTAAITSGSLTGCTWQVLLQTQDQRPTTATNPTGGTCASSCYRLPAFTFTAVPTANAATVVAPFSKFGNPSGSAIAASTQIVGLQWQVLPVSGSCTLELRIDDIKFVLQ